jgi:hypothetical protein
MEAVTTTNAPETNINGLKSVSSAIMSQGNRKRPNV